jgi:restriction endonuclease S subunit
MTKTGRINTDNSSLGRAALFLGKDNSANINGHVYLIRLAKNQAHEFVLQILISEQFKDLIREVCVGGIDKRQLNKNHLEEFPIIYPPIELQHQFIKMFQSIESQKIAAAKSASYSNRYFDSLIQKAFKGELVA